MATETIDIRIREDGSRVVKRNLEDVGNTAEKAASGVDILKRALGALTAFIAVDQIRKYADAWASASGKIRIATRDIAESSATQERLYQAAQNTRQGFGDIVDLYSRVARASNELGASQGELVLATENVGKILAYSGTTAEQAQGALLQLGQALGGGVVRAEEFNSVLEGAPAILQVVASHVDGVGGSIGKLRSMVVEGKLSSREFFDALLAGSADIDAKFSQASVTLSQGFVMVSNAMMRWIGQTDSALGISGELGQAMRWVASNMDEVAAAAVSAGAALAVAFTPAAITTVAGAVTSLWAVLAANPLGAVVVAVTAVVTYLVMMRDALRVGIDDVTTLGDVFRALGEKVPPALQVVAEVAASVFDEMSSAARSAYQAITQSTGQETASWAAQYSSFYADIGGGFAGVAQGIARTIDAIAGLLTGLGIAMARAFGGIPALIVEAFDRAYNATASAVEATINTVIDGINRMRGAVGLGLIDAIKIDLRQVDPGAFEAYGRSIAQSIDAGFQAEGGAAENWVTDLFARAQEIAHQAGAAQEAVVSGAGAATAAIAAQSDAINGAAKEAKKYRDALQRVLDEINPLAAREREYQAQLSLVSRALRDGTGNTEELIKAQATLKQRLEELKAPLRAVTDEHQRNVDALSQQLEALRQGDAAYEAYLAQQAATEEAERRINALLSAGYDLRQDERAAILDQTRVEVELRKQIEAEEQARKSANKAWEGLITEIVGAFVDSADSIGAVWSDLLGRLKREIINFGAAAAVGMAAPNTPILSGVGQVLGGQASKPVEVGTSTVVNALFSGGKLFPGVEKTVTNVLTQIKLQGGVLGKVSSELLNATANIARLPGGLVGGGLITAGAGMLGSQLGEMAFGSSGTLSQIGSVAGGLAGAAFAPIALGALGGPIGAIAGGFLGSALGGIFGGKKKKRRAAVWVNPPEGQETYDGEYVFDDVTAASGLRFVLENKRMGDEGHEAVQAVADQFKMIDDLLTSVTENAGIEVDLSKTQAFGRGLFKITEDATKDFTRTWINAISESFDAELKAATGALTGDTAEELANAYSTLMLIVKDISEGGIFSTLDGGLSEIAKIAGAIGPDAVQRVSAFSAQLRSLSDLMDADPMQEWEQSQRSIFELWRDQGDAIVSAADAAVSEQDFSLISAAIRERYATELQLIEQIQSALQTVNDQFSRTFETIFLDGLKSEEDKYNYFKSRADALAQSISTITDPQEILKAAEAYNSAVMSAYNALGPATRDLLREEILSTIQEVQAAANEQLQVALGAISADRNEDVPGSVANAVEAAIARATEEMTKSLTEAVRGFAAVSDENQKAADVQLSAAKLFESWSSRLPERIQVNIAAGSELTG